ncbi:MAG: amino acid permease C-terminal domain-containing protein [Terracidiphilus sp.]
MGCCKPQSIQRRQRLIECHQHAACRFRVPFGPIIPALSVIFCFLLMAGLPIITWMRFIIWLAIGLIIYFL